MYYKKTYNSLLNILRVDFRDKKIKRKNKEIKEGDPKNKKNCSIQHGKQLERKLKLWNKAVEIYW